MASDQMIDHVGPNGPLNDQSQAPPTAEHVAEDPPISLNTPPLI